jgi:ribosomal subunit interface protein
MQLSVTGRHIDIGDALRQHMADSLGGIFQKYVGDAQDVDVILSRDGAFYHARINAHIGRGVKLVAEHRADKPYGAFDGAAAHLSKRVRRYKRRLRDHHADEAPALDMVAARQYVLSGEPESTEDESEDTGEAAASEPAVIAEMAHEIPSLTVSEAVMRLDLAALPAMMFRNAAHGGFNMVYRRADGHIGWIDPEGNNAG